jgi:hypothetical protein
MQRSWLRPRGCRLGHMPPPGSPARPHLLLLLLAAAEEIIFERAMYDVVPLERWVSTGGAVALLGDSAHAMHPITGQGARSAFEVRGATRVHACVRAAHGRSRSCSHRLFCGAGACRCFCCVTHGPGVAC